jgi:hypothetical protein
MGRERGGGNPKAARHLVAAKPGERGAYNRGGRRKGSRNLVTKADVEGLIRDIAFFKPGDLLARVQMGERATFTLEEIRNLPTEVQHAIAGYDVVTQNLEGGDGKQETVVKIRWFDKAPYVQMLARHFKIISDKEQTTNVQVYVDRLQAARAIINQHEPTALNTVDAVERRDH